MNKKNILASLSFALLSPMVIASETISFNDLTTYPSIWVSGNLGLGETNKNSTLLNNSIYPTLKLMAGYDMNRYLGMYSSYDFIDKIQEDNSINIFSLGFKGHLPIFDVWSVFGKVGISYLNGNTDSYNVSGSVGLGVEYQISNSISTQIEIGRAHV